MPDLNPSFKEKPPNFWTTFVVSVRSGQDKFLHIFLGVKSTYCWLNLICSHLSCQSICLSFIVSQWKRFQNLTDVQLFIVIIIDVLLLIISSARSSLHWGAPLPSLIFTQPSATMSQQFPLNATRAYTHTTYITHAQDILIQDEANHCAINHLNCLIYQEPTDTKFPCNFFISRGFDFAKELIDTSGDRTFWANSWDNIYVI